MQIAAATSAVLPISNNLNDMHCSFGYRPPFREYPHSLNTAYNLTFFLVCRQVGNLWNFRDGRATHNMFNDRP